MSLQDDIARWANEGAYPSTFWERIAAGLESDYYLVKLADLPEVTIDESDSDLVVVDGNRYYEDTPAFYRRMAHENLALAHHLEARESEAAVLARRRDELAREHWGTGTTYSVIGGSTRGIIDRLIAAEAELARLKEARS